MLAAIGGGGLIPTISAAGAALAALSTILLGYLRWGREDVGKAAETAKLLIETMQAVNDEIQDSMTRLSKERDALRREVARLEKRLQVANDRIDALELALLRAEQLAAGRREADDAGAL
jgi:FtsZ-binding cell division protein ZapB